MTKSELPHEINTWTIVKIHVAADIPKAKTEIIFKTICI